MSEEEANNTSISQLSQSQPPPRYPRILLGITGSVAAVKGPELAVRLVKELEAEVRIVLTRGGYNFWTKAETYHPEYWREFKYLETSAVNPKQEQEERLERQNKNDSISVHDDGEEEEDIDLLEEQPNIQVHYAEDEWADWKQLGDSILHIDLRDWADLIVIAPLSAHTLAKLAHGLCDDTLSCVMRAWDFGYHPDPQQRPGKPVVLAPAMNTAMWEHPLTGTQLRTITDFWKPNDNNVDTNSGVSVVSPQVKQLACGEVGNGAMANVDDIISVVKSAIELHSRETTIVNA